MNYVPWLNVRSLALTFPFSTNHSGCLQFWLQMQDAIREANAHTEILLYSMQHSVIIYITPNLQLVSQTCCMD